MRQAKKELISSLKSWFVVNVQQSVWVLESKTARNMELTTLSLNASSVVQLPSGSVGETPTSVSRATNDKLTETMYHERPRRNSLNAETHQRVP